jgi:hypothetical protein
MSRTEKLTELLDLQAKVDAIREELQINPVGKVIYSSVLDVCGSASIVVEADGFGGATVSVVEGNYPVDYVTKFERFFGSEFAAVSAAEKLSSGNTNASEVLADRT